MSLSLPPEGSYVPLHVHAEPSELDGLFSVEDYVARCVELGITSAALTDHGTMAGLPSFVAAATKAGVKAIPGVEFYLPQRGYDRTNKDAQRTSHLTVIATDPVGYDRLMQLTTMSFQDPDRQGGFYYKPRIDVDLLCAEPKGLIVLSGCVAGPIAQALVPLDPEGVPDHAHAHRIAGQLKDTFGDRFFLEVMQHYDAQGRDECATLTRALLALGQQLEIPLVATTDSHYLRREDHATHDLLLAMQTKQQVDDPARKLKHTAFDYHLWTPQEMQQAWRELPWVVTQGRAIAEQVHNPLPLAHPELPDLFPGWTHLQYWQRLREETHAGVLARVGKGGVLPAVYQERLDYELRVLKGKEGFPLYFLIIGDLVRAARQQGMLVLPRGSGVGALLSYGLGICEIDPVHWNIPFERFITEERTELPDYDLDFAPQHIPWVHRYLQQKYGEAHVGLISTTSHMKGRACLRDVARTMGMLADKDTAKLVDTLAKLVPQGLQARTLEECADQIDGYRALLHSSPTLTRLHHLAIPFERLAKGQGTHPAGVIITKRKLTDVVPLRRPDKTTDMPVTLYDMKAVEQVAVKVDILKVDAIGAVTTTIEHLGWQLDDLWDRRKLPLDDQRVLETYRKGQTVGCFQVSEWRMREVMQKLAPQRIEEIRDGIALYRPGPMDLIPEYIARKRGRKPVALTHPSLAPLLGDTYGLVVYQDQMLRILVDALGYTWGEADQFRKAVGKKDPKLLARLLPDLKQKALRKGWTEEQADEMVHTLLPFAGYGFGVGHGTAYMFLSYFTAFFLTHYPAVYLSSMLNAHLGEPEKAIPLVEVARKRGLSVRGPDINRSQREWVPEGKVLRAGFGAVKGVGDKAAEGLLRARGEQPFVSWQELFLRTASERSVTTAVIGHLALAGAFPATWGHPAQLAAASTEVWTKWAKKAIRWATVDPGVARLAGKTLEEPALPPQVPFTTKEWHEALVVLLGFIPSLPALPDGPRQTPLKLLTEHEPQVVSLPPDVDANAVRQLLEQCLRCPGETLFTIQYRAGGVILSQTHCQVDWGRITPALRALQRTLR